MENTELNFDRLCRACKNESENLKSVFEIFDVPDKPRIAEMLMACASVQVMKGDGLPNSMCMPCISQLKDAYTFRKQCELTDNSLRDYMRQKCIKQEVPTDETGEIIDIASVINNMIDVKQETDSLQVLVNENVIFSCTICNKQFASPAGLKFHKRNHAEYGENLNKCHVCNKEYSCLSHLQRHLRLHYPHKIYTCKICNKSLSRLEHLKRHMVIHLKTKPHICKICKRGFNKEDNLYAHEQRCKGQRPHICPICNRGFNREDSLQVHMSAHDSSTESKPMLDSLDDIENYIHIENYIGPVDALVQKNLLEPQVNITETDEFSDNDKDDFDRRSDGDSNEVNEDNSVEQNDEEENKTTVNEDSPVNRNIDPDWKPEAPAKRKRGRPRKGEVRVVASVIKKKRGRKPGGGTMQRTVNTNKIMRQHSCDQCERSFATPLDLEIHSLKHAGIEKFNCKICFKEFLRGDHLKRHMISHLESKPFSCDICSKQFTRKDHMVRHVKLHSLERKYECDICKRMFSREQLLTKHKAIKHGIGERVVAEKKFKCDICDKLFTTEKYRDVHMKAHSEKDKILNCKTCGQHFETRAELVIHLRTTNDCSRRFLCSECGQRFTKKDYLQVHMRRHRGEKPFKCRFCDKGFPRTTDLKAHEKCHTGEKNHLCIVCGKGFGRAYKLTLHMRTHTGEKPYQCTYCDAAFAQSNDLKAHIRRHTGERYHCDMCSEAFLMGYMLTQHKRNVHGVEVPPSQRPLPRVQATQPVIKPELRRPAVSLDPRSGQMFSLAISQTLNLLNNPNYTV